MNYDQNIFSGEVKAISSFNEKGAFDILGTHTNLISIIKEKITIYIDKKEEKEFKINKGIIYCLDNQVKVFLGV